ncbi:MAG: L-histidine N(alpha)-methyltransferase [Candidatus Paceibacterota bacterium]
MKKYTEKDTENFYDKEDSLYRSFWDKNGSLHWGLFKEEDEEYLEATENLTELMVEKAGIDSNSKILDLGCGNGESSIQLADEFKCEVVGVDISGVRIKNAKEKLQKSKLSLLVKFLKGTATNLPFENNEFTHVWSQSTIYHVHNKDKALKEIYRVLKNDGIFVFDDLLKPKENISKETEKHVYDRLLFDTPFSFETYKDKLKEIGFNITYLKDISPHLQKSYEELINILKKKTENKDDYEDKYKSLIYSYKKMVDAIKNKELGWGIYLCNK